MKATLLKSIGKVILEDIESRDIKDDEVRVEVKYCGICGSDIRGVADGEHIPLGTYMGHEFSGVIAEVGRNVPHWKRGDRVVVNPMGRCGKCYACKHKIYSACSEAVSTGIGISAGIDHAGAFCKYVRVPKPEYRLFHLPDEISFEAGALVEPLACSMHAINMSIMQPEYRAMVLGCGTIGLGVTTFLKNLGSQLVIVTEPNVRKAEVAKKVGADYVFNPYVVTDLEEVVFEITNGDGVDVVFDCSGVEEVFQKAPNFLRPRGQVLLVGVITHPVQTIPNSYTNGEKTLQASVTYIDEFPSVINTLRKHVVPISEMITTKIKLSNIIQKGFSVLAKPNDEIKVLVEPDV
ncbi:alcohol dehydrogenase catalytic domain-containing protein [Chloroflexota bacterium]